MSTASTPYPPASPVLPRPSSGPSHARIILRPSSTQPVHHAPTPLRPTSADEEDELRDDDAQVAERRIPTLPKPNLPSTSGTGSQAPSPRPTGGAAGSGTSKSRKSSCDLCHHRKIKCDQLRPACSSCIRKGQPCRYAEEAEANTTTSRVSQHQRAISVTVVNPADPNIKYNLAVPGGQQTPLKSGNAPEWKVSENGHSNGNAEKKNRRDRIVAGFDSDSDDEAEANGSAAASVKTKPDVDIELAALADGKEEVDELDEEVSVASLGSKRREVDSAMDDDLSGELASAPPKKKKKYMPPPPPAPVNRPLPKPVAPRGAVSGRHSLGNLPTPATSSSAMNFARLPDATWLDPYTSPLQSLAQGLPVQETQNILFHTFFSDPFLTEGISLLQPQFVEDFKGFLERRTTRFQQGDATTLANAFAFLAIALRILPEETSRLLLATQSYSATASQIPRSLPRVLACLPASTSDPTPLDQRYCDLALLAAQLAEQTDPPSVMLVMFKLAMYRFATLGHRRDQIVLAGTWLAQAAKIAQALGMGKEWEGLSQGERELRRRIMWSLYVADRHHSFETAFPYTIMDAHQGIHLPSPMSETDLYQLAPDTRELPAHSTELAPTSCTALFIHTHLARRITPILDSFATISAANTPHDLVLRFDASLDAFQDALPPYFRLFPMAETRFDSSHPYLAAHRVRLHATLLAYRSGVHRTHLITYLNPTTPPALRNVIASVCISSIRVQRSARMLDPKVAFRIFNPLVVFENAMTLALILYVDKAVAAATATGRVSDFMNNRTGLAEAAEMLDNVGSGEGAIFARSAVMVLREITSRVDAPPRGISQNGDHDGKYEGIGERRGSVGHSIGTGPGSTGGSPRASLSLAEMNGNRARSGSGTGSASGADGHSTIPFKQDPYIQSILAWLDSLRQDGINMDVLLRETEWNGAWERVINGM